MSEHGSSSGSPADGIVEFFRACIGQEGVWAAGPPFTRWLDGRLVEVDPGRIVIDYLVREEMTNPAGRLHGGIQCAMLDDVIGLAAYTLGRDGFHLSVNLATDYLGRADAGEVVRAEGEIVRRGRRMVHARGELSTLDGDTVATASSNLLHADTAVDLPGG